MVFSLSALIRLAFTSIFFSTESIASFTCGGTVSFFNSLLTLLALADL
jgi:hypothetical protein